MNPEEICKFLEETECRNMLLSILRGMFYIEKVDCISHFYINHSSFYNFVSLGNSYLDVRTREKTNPIWGAFQQNPGELSKILQALMKPIDIEILSYLPQKSLGLIKIEFKRILTIPEIRRTGLFQGFRMFFKKHDDIIWKVDNMMDLYE
jgi:hypothetical protein